LGKKVTEILTLDKFEVVVTESIPNGAGALLFLVLEFDQEG
jgi:hypothetical protein